MDAVSAGDDETVKMYFKDALRNKFSIYEKKKFEIMMRHHGSLLAKGELASSNTLPSLICYLQKPPVGINDILNKKHLCPASSSRVSSKTSISQLSEEPVSRNRLMGGISANADLRERSVVEKEIEKNVGLEARLNCFSRAKRTNTTEVFRVSNICPYCDYSNTQLARHIREVHGRERPYKCEKCNYRAKRKHRLQDHMDLMHDGNRPYKCDKCEFRACYKSKLKHHMDVVHDGKRPFKCEVCLYRASELSQLKIHMDAIHEGKKPYKCPHCDFCAGFPKSVKVHLKGKH